MRKPLILTLVIVTLGGAGLRAQETSRSIRRDRAESPAPKADESAPMLVIETGGFTGGVNGLSFSPDGRYLAGVGADGTVRIWDMQSGALRNVLRGQAGAVSGYCYAVAFSPNGLELVVGANDPNHTSALRVYRTSDLSQIAELVPGPKFLA
jgi:WD40 repeat protein